MKTTFAILCLLTFGPLSANGEVVTYNVDLGGIADSGHTLHVAGTISYDRAANSIISSALMFFHESDPPFLMPGPTIFPGNGISNLESTSTELYFVWDSFFSFEDEGFAWGTQSQGRFSFGLIEDFAYVELNNIDIVPDQIDSVFPQFVIGEPQGRFLIGTAVPEPSSIVLAGIGGLSGLGFWLRRRNA